MITKEQAMALKYRDTLHHVSKKDSRGDPVAVRVNGKCRTWSTRTADWSLPVKHGLSLCFTITNDTAQYWVLP